ncbi:helix-turn-helix domain-containing protein [Glutamicibacter sp. NPDC087344]|uniref:helix-turn-helix domain-containing protein n=1 Tax=Glutamicibacter sp. NPDC087344 TaxID=3363994 RepID=UPI003809BD55
MAEPDMTVEEVAAELRQSTTMVRKLANRGKFPGAYKGGTGGRTSAWRIPRAALDKYRNSQPHGYRM